MQGEAWQLRGLLVCLSRDRRLEVAGFGTLCVGKFGRLNALASAPEVVKAGIYSIHSYALVFA